MVRLWLLLGVVVTVFYIYSVVDCALFERGRVRGLPKAVWIVVVVVFPIIGGLLWFLVGRGSRRAVAGRARGVAPDDDPDFLGKISRERAQRAREQEERIRRLERELAELDDTPKKNKGDTDQPGRRDA